MMTHHQKLKTKVGNDEMRKDLFSTEFLTKSINVSPHVIKELFLLEKAYHG
jgi:hypothetical protein